MCVCSLNYPAWKAHALCYIAISGLSGSTAFSTLSHEWHDFQKKKKVIEHKIGVQSFSESLNIKWAFGVSLQLLSETFLVLRRIQPDTVTNLHISVFM